MSVRIFSIITLSVYFIFLSHLSFAQNKCKLRSLSRISVNVFPDDSVISENESTLVNIMKNKLKENHLYIYLSNLSPDDLSEDYEFIVGTKDLKNSGEVIATVVVMQKIPAEVVDIGAKEEALYKVISSDKPKSHTPEVEQIRQKMSAEYMRNFGKIDSYYIDKIRSNEMNDFCTKVITTFLAADKKK